MSTLWYEVEGLGEVFDCSFVFVYLLHWVSESLITRLQLVHIQRYWHTLLVQCYGLLYISIVSL